MTDGAEALQRTAARWTGFDED